MERMPKIFKSLLFILALLLFSISMKVAAKEQDDLKNVLILNSYHQGLTWTKEQTEGITETLKHSSYNVEFLIEAMDWKNYPSADNLKLLYEYYKFKYSNKKIDLIITTDDAALQFALEHRGEIFSDAPVIFSGVNQEGAERITKGYQNVTGVFEEIFPAQTIQLALKINPSINNIYLLYDNTESGITIGRFAEDEIGAEFPDVKIISMNNRGYDDIINTVKNLGNDSIVLMTSYIRDVHYKIMEIDYIIHDVSSNSSVPVYHLYDFSLNNGVIGGVMLSGRLQGQYAGNLAIRILSGEDPDSIPFFTPDTNRRVLDYRQMEHYGISMKSVPEGFEIINKPFSFYETYKTLVLSVIAVVTVLIILINILLIYLRRIRRMKKNLSESHEELTQLYEELTASDEEMRQQYDEILEINEKIRIGDEKLSYLAYHDALTGLPNRLSLYENATNIFHSEKEKTALLFIDIDNFKNVNDTMGHDFGDQLIKDVSQRLTTLFENNENIYRLSGDEFIILLQNIKEVNDIQGIASEILRRFSSEIHIQESVLRVSVSIGISIYPDHGDKLDQLLKYADIAMYKVKENGRENYIMYDSFMSEVFTERVNIEKYLHKALDNNEFELYYQPQVDLTRNRIAGFEALLRWNSPELGRVSPIKFIKVAEDTRYIIPLGTWVLKTACAFLQKLRHMGYTDLYVSVNISILQLLQKDFCEIIYDTLDQYKLEPNSLELEITETILMESFDSIEMELKKLSESNIKIALDDFGKGYSSLSYLRQLPIKTLKIDKSFIDCIIDQNEGSLTGQIVTLGKSMGMSIVAEGVEKQEQLEYLMQYECDKIQGYYFSKPLPEKELVKLLESSIDLSHITRRLLPLR